MPVPLSARAYVAAVSAVGTAVLVAVLVAAGGLRTGAPLTSVCLALALLTVLGEMKPVVVRRDEQREEIVVSTAVSLALLFIGPLELALAVQCTAVALVDLRDRKGVTRAMFNVGQYALTLTAARAAYASLSGTPLLDGAPLSLPGDLAAALVAGVVYLVVNDTLTGLASSLWYRMPLREALYTDVGFNLTTTGVQIALAPVLAVAAVSSLWLLPLLLLPIVVVQRSAQLVADRERAALHDDVTDLPNRALLRRRASRAVEQEERTAVVSLDLDHFKGVNDTLGHAVGDELLRAVAARLRGAVRPEDTVARTGGDEFVVLASVHDVDGAVALAGRLLRSLDEPFSFDGLRLGVAASAGVAVHPESADDAETLLQRADIALDTAKASRGSARLYDPATDLRTPERLTLAAEVRDALDNGELFLQHQPQVDVVTGRTLGFESLVRWRHPRRGLVFPDTFLPVVEGSGLIGPLTAVVLDLALEALAGWRAAGHDVTVSVNLSVRNLADPTLPDQVEEALARHGVPARALVLEVTETMVMDDPDRARDVLSRLRALGVELAVDDFGTGCSSLAYLQRLAVHELKIDRSFVGDITRSPGDAVIVRSTVEMGRALGLRLVAEGVEDEATLAMLREWGCESAQGWLFAKAMDDVDVLPWLASRQLVPAPR